MRTGFDGYACAAQSAGTSAAATNASSAAFMAFLLWDLLRVDLEFPDDFLHAVGLLEDRRGKFLGRCAACHDAERLGPGYGFRRGHGLAKLRLQPRGHRQR